LSLLLSLIVFGIVFDTGVDSSDAKATHPTPISSGIFTIRQITNRVLFSRSVKTGFLLRQIAVGKEIITPLPRVNHLVNYGFHVFVLSLKDQNPA
jgi:hypothetical protein